MNRGWYILKCGLFVLLAVVVIGFITKLLWNWLVPTLFSGPEINYWQALGLLILSKILFWGLGGKRHDRCTPGDHASQQWKHRFSEKFSNMSPEEREAFKQKMKDKWCSWEKNTSDKDSGGSSDSEAGSEKIQ
jgi:hypothetical protein